MTNLYTILKPGAVVSFDVYPSTYYPNLSHLKVEAILNYEAAIAMGLDPASVHVRAAPMLPDTAPRSHTEYDYVLVSNNSNQRFLIGLPWIKEASVIVHESLTLDCVFENLSQSDIERLRTVLQQNGFHNVQFHLR